MIKYIDNDDTFVGVISALKYDTFLTKILVTYSTYGISKYADFWYQFNEGGSTSLFTRLGGQFVLYLSDGSDTEEVSEFLNVVGFNSVLYNEKYKINVKSFKNLTGVIMKLNSKVTPQIYETTEEKNYKEVYNFFSNLNSSSIVLPDYGDFVTGLYGKIRNNTAKIRSIYNDYNIVSCCITVTDNINTIINAVGTDKNYRNKDYAKTLIYNMSGKNTYLYCNDDIHTVIYEKMGFKIVGKWKEIYR